MANGYLQGRTKFLSIQTERNQQAQSILTAFLPAASLLMASQPELTEALPHHHYMSLMKKEQLSVDLLRFIGCK